MMVKRNSECHHEGRELDDSYTSLYSVSIKKNILLGFAIQDLWFSWLLSRLKMAILHNLLYKEISAIQIDFSGFLVI